MGRGFDLAPGQRRLEHSQTELLLGLHNVTFLHDNDCFSASDLLIAWKVHRQLYYVPMLMPKHNGVRENIEFFKGKINFRQLARTRFPRRSHYYLDSKRNFISIRISSEAFFVR